MCMYELYNNSEKEYIGTRRRSKIWRWKLRGAKMNKGSNNGKNKIGLRKTPTVGTIKRSRKRKMKEDLFWN